MGIIQSVHDKQSAGDISKVNLSAAQAASELLSKAGVGGTRLEIRCECKGLPSKDLTSKSDPMLVLFQAPATGETVWREVGRTDVVANCADPQFVKPLLVSYTAGGVQPMRVVVYDVDRLARKPEALNLASQDYLGEAEFMFADVVNAPGCSLQLQLVDLVAGKQLPKGCVAVLKAETMAADNDQVVRMAFSGSNLAKKDKMSESDPFLRGLKLRQGSQDDWVPVFKTEVRDNNENPLWNPIEVDIRQLCSADDQRPLKLQVWDFNTSGSHQLIGEVTTTLAALKALQAAPQDSPDRTFELVGPASKTGGRPGTLTVRQIMVKPSPSLQQTMGGCLAACLG